MKITTQTWTEEKFIKQSPCPEGMVFCRDRQFDWPRVWQECEDGEWLIWALKRCGVDLDKMTWVKIAVASAEHVLEIFEKRFPEDKRPRQAIVAAQAWIERPCEETRSAAYAAAYAAYAADAAAAADAADANASNAAADAAYAAYSAAAAAAAADAYAAAKADYAAYAAKADYAAYAAYAAADAAAADADDAAAADAYAAAYAAARKKERYWQADMIRRMVGECPVTVIT